MQTSHSCPHCLHHLERFNWEDSESPWLLRNVLLCNLHIYIYIHVICYIIRYCISSNHSDQLKMHGSRVWTSMSRVWCREKHVLVGSLSLGSWVGKHDFTMYHAMWPGWAVLPQPSIEFPMPLQGTVKHCGKQMICFEFSKRHLEGSKYAKGCNKCSKLRSR